MNNKYAEHCLKAADALQKDIDKKHTSARNMRALPPTRKRIQDSQGIYNDAVRLEKYQTLLRRLAEMHEAGTIPADVQHIHSRAAVEREVFRNQTLMNMFQTLDRTETPAEKVQRMERELLLRGIPGFFPTPREQAGRLVHLVSPIRPGSLVLEPEAGTGALIDAVLREQSDIRVHYFEVNYTLCDFLAAKYGDDRRIYQPGRDFTEIVAATYAPRYDIIVMNPPFENGQDAQHIQLAYELLAPGGQLAAIAGSGVFFRSDKRSTAFREFLEQTDAVVEAVPDGAFKSVGTGVSCKTVFIEKPEAAVAAA
jgi:phospholipid N-methyltransferase